VRRGASRRHGFETAKPRPQWRAPARTMATLAAGLLAGVSALWAAPLELSPEPPPEVVVDGSAAAEAALAPVLAEQQAEVEAREHAERSDTMLRYDFDSRGPTWTHNGGQVNPADHPTRLERNEALQEYMRSIETATPARRNVATATETVLRMDSVPAGQNPRAPLQWVRSGWLAAAVVLLLMGWFGAKLLQRRPRRSRRHRHPGAGATSPRMHRHRRRRHRRPRDAGGGAGNAA
jgi:hypothetical protein